MKAVLRNYNQAVRKVRLVANMVRGKRADEALLLLAHTPRKGSKAVAKLIKSALANAGASVEEAASFRIQNITVDKGIVLRRYMPRARGMASPIRREKSHISLSLASAAESHREKFKRATGRRGTLQAGSKQEAKEARDPEEGKEQAEA
jgi:large subunit ribosomal protein L22